MYEPSGPFLEHEATRDVSTLTLDGMLVHCRVTLTIKFASAHLHTWVERGTVRVKCLAQEHNAMSPARARSQIAGFEGEHINQEATAPTRRS